MNKLLSVKNFTRNVNCSHAHSVSLSAWLGGCQVMILRASLLLEMKSMDYRNSNVRKDLVY